jgi:hypothetical protein
MFPGLPEGNYRLVAEARGDTLVQVRPRSRTVRRRRETTETDFDFL